MKLTHVSDTQKFAAEIRLYILKQLTHLGFGHAGGSLSIADLVAVLYNGEMNVDPRAPQKPDRDRLIISKGHSGPAFYAALALKGFFPMEWLDTLNIGGTNLPSHTDAHKTPGIDFTTGSLGQGLSPAIGIAYALRFDGRPQYVYAILGDGECQEGQIWEAAMAASKYKLDHLICFLDYNKYQLDGSIQEIMPLADVFQKFQAFGWYTQQIDGHDIKSIIASIELAKAQQGKPNMIILDTIKGKGCSEFEKLKHLCHHLHISKEMSENAMNEINEQLKQLKEI